MKAHEAALMGFYGQSRVDSMAANMDEAMSARGSNQIGEINGTTDWIRTQVTANVASQVDATTRGLMGALGDVNSLEDLAEVKAAIKKANPGMSEEQLDRSAGQIARGAMDVIAHPPQLMGIDSKLVTAGIVDSSISGKEAVSAEWADHEAVIRERWPPSIE